MFLLRMLNTPTSISNKIPPVVVILGCTAVGKTKLSLQLASKFTSEIISADSMQIYNNLDIATGKATKEEQQIVPHHLLSFVDPVKDNFTVHDFKQKALPVISTLIARHTMPLVVGGTNYYIESLLWDFTISMQTEKQTMQHAATPKQYPDPTPELYERLQTVDPSTAHNVHPNNRRKILTALFHFDIHGCPISQAYDKQHGNMEASRNVKHLHGKLRFPQAVGLLISCDPQVLEQRINDRVDSMLQQGLIEELDHFYCTHHAQRDNLSSCDFQCGLYQVLGFKELVPFLGLSQDERASRRGQTLLHEGVQLMKQRSLRYAKSQTKWIQKRFLTSDSFPIYALDSSDLSRWDELVFTPSVHVIESLTQGVTPTIAPLNAQDASCLVHRPQHLPRFECSVCDLVMFGEASWTQHLKGRKHAHFLKRKQLTQTSKVAETQTSKESITETETNPC